MRQGSHEASGLCGRLSTPSRQEHPPRTPHLPTLSRSCEVGGFGGHLPAFPSVSLPRLPGQMFCHLYHEADNSAFRIGCL